MILYPGTAYTLKVDDGQLFQFTGADTVKDRAAWFMDGTGSIHSVERISGMRYFLVRLDVIKETNSETVSGIIRTAFQQSGYEGAEVIDIQAGTATSNVFKEVLKEAATDVTPILKPASDYLLKIIGMILLGAALFGSLYIYQGGKRNE